MDNNEGFVEVILRDFKKPALNGREYKMDDPDTTEAIEGFCKRRCVYGEEGHPVIPPDAPYDRMVQRYMQVELERAIVLIQNITYSKEEQILRGWVKPITERYPHLLDELKAGKIRFGMRSITVPNPGFDGRYPITSIITFDVIGFK